MIRLSNLTLMRAAKVLLKDTGVTLFPGHKVGLVGPNGCGKSSLFAMLLGGLQPEAGSVEMPPNWIIAHVAQDAEAAPTSALEHVLDGDQELREVERLLAQAESEGNGERIAELHQRMDHIGGYQARVRAASARRTRRARWSSSPAAGACASISPRR
jgi:ATP-binding cassette, subfamily F, member 3